MIKHQLFIGAALLVGVAIGYFVKDEPVAAEEPAQVEENVKHPVADKGEAATVSALRREIVRLKKALAEKDDEGEKAISNAVEKARQQPAHFRNQREWLADLKKNEPERYVEMTNRFARWRWERAEQVRDKIDFLSSIDTSRMGAAAKKTHADLQRLIVRREELEAQLQQEELSDEDRSALQRELANSHGEIWRLNGEERKNLLDEVAGGLGFEDDAVRDFTDTILGVFEATDNGWGGRRHRGPRNAGGAGGR